MRSIKYVHDYCILGIRNRVVFLPDRGRVFEAILGAVLGGGRHSLVTHLQTIPISRLSDQLLTSEWGGGEGGLRLEMEVIGG
jgi:hypothetical protein